MVTLRLSMVTLRLGIAVLALDADGSRTDSGLTKPFNLRMTQTIERIHSHGDCSLQ